MNVNDPSIRTFVAAELTEDVHAELARVQAELGRERLKFRWVKPKNIHLTLVFLGHVDPAVLEDIYQVVAEVVRPHAPIQLVTNGLGVFPGIKRARVIWAGLTGEVKRLGELKASLDRSLASVSGLAYKPETRSFRAHLTLGRAKGRIDARKLALALERLQPQLMTRFAVDNIHVFKSDLKPDGAVYTKLTSAVLG